MNALAKHSLHNDFVSGEMKNKLSDTPANEIAKTSPNMRTERLEQLKILFPDLFDGEGQLDEKALRALISNEAGMATERFSFAWAGKQQSKRLAFTPSRATLSYDPGRSLNSDGTENKAGETPQQNTSKNLIIEGDNLEVLKLLQATYFEQVKCIYIDPPYNTGHDFIYPDNFTAGKKAYWEKSGEVKEGVKLTALPETHGRRHSDWLNFMQSRLLLARQLLRDDGVIFISIDDNEQANLKKLCDAVFGEENFIGNAGRITKKSNNKGDFWAGNFDYVLTYAKSIKDTVKFFGGVNYAAYNLVETDGPMKGEKYQLVRMYMSSLQNRNPEQRFFIECPDGSKVIPPGTTLPPERPVLGDGIWRWTRKKMEEEKDRIVIKKVKSSNLVTADDSPAKWNVFAKTYLSDVIANASAKPNSLIEDHINQIGSHEINKLDIPFDFSKPGTLIKYLIEISKSDDDSIILDFFAGSGTSAHAVMQKNAEDGGKRKHIMVQIPEITDEKSEAYQAGYKKISDITIERVKRAGAKIREENPDARTDTGFRVFKLTHSNFAENLFTPDEDKSEEENIKALNAHLEKAAQMRLFDSDEFSNLVTEISLKNGFGLFYQLEAMSDFEHNKVYRLHGNGKTALLCVDNTLHDVSVENLKAFNEKQLIVSKAALDTSKKFSLQTEFKDNLWVV